MANQEHLAILRQGVDAWNAWQKHSDVRPDFSEADLSGAYLRRADLRGAYLRGVQLTMANFGEADLSGAYLRGVQLTGAYLSQANLSEANLSRATLWRANLSRATLWRANLSRATLWRANLSGANLYGADISQASVNSTIFASIDLSTVIGLGSVQYLGPSTIGIDTLYMSNGAIPEAFLRGCGVPDPHIEYLPALIGAMQPIQFYSCFISYSSQDDDFARRLHERMRAEHLRVWFAPEDMQGGQKQEEQIEQAIRVYDKLLVHVGLNKTTVCHVEPQRNISSKPRWWRDPSLRLRTRSG